MVFTRNQKRKLEESDTTLEDYEIADFSNIKIKKRRKELSENEYDVSSDKSDVSSDKSDDKSDDKISDNSLQSSKELGEISIDESDSDTNESYDDDNINQESFDNLGNFLSGAIQNVLKNTLFRKEDNETNIFKDDYDKYLHTLSSIYNGNFFQRSPKYEKKNELKQIYTNDDIKFLNEELQKIKDEYQKDTPSIIDILTLNTDVSQKQKLLEKMFQFSNSEVLTQDYFSSLKTINTELKRSNDQELLELEKKILEHSNNLKYSDNYKEKILRSDMSFENKVIAYKKLQVMESFESNDTSEYSKYKAWMDILLSIPFTKNVGIQFPKDLDSSKTIIQNVRSILDKRLSFLEKAKDQIINIISQMIRNPEFKINAIGLYGTRGIGKTSLVKSISEALGRPYRTISLGGESDSSLLTGHGFTYVGSCPGRIIEILRETQCTNPIILFDELDKVSETHHGKEIIGNLIHLTDSTTNTKYNYDKYFSGIEFDLSKVLFIFTYNDATKIDPILADRLFKIHIDNYSFKEKMEITKRHLIDSILQEYCFTTDDIVFNEDTIRYIIESSKSDQGMRDIKRRFEIIISRINTLLLTDIDQNIVRLEYKQLYNYYKTSTKPIVIPKEHIDTLLTNSINNDLKQNDPPFGMYI